MRLTSSAGRSSYDLMLRYGGYSFSMGTASSLASPPDSSSISSTPMARQRTTAPIWIGNGVRTSTSAGSPSFDSVCGM
ncbi:Uncharacterised protein [Bordetella pertussis]|nr:Uncharacterised protein [Bordetella pertussis]CPN13438.1 Uncharacterised protein [Bordetella pertussis]CPN41112.1 Uncharacterised protein [Bordetella pertussis]